MTTAAPKPEITEIATAQKAEGIMGSALWRGILQPGDQTLIDQGGSRGYRVYADLTKDPVVYGCLTKRKLALISRPWRVDASGEDAGDIAAAKLVERCLLALDFDRICLDLLDALLMGFSVAEILWSVEGGVVVPTAILPRAPERFAFDAAGQLRLRTMAEPVQGEPLPERKFIIHQWQCTDANPYGIGIGRILFWPVFFKRNGLSFWASFVERYGSPFLVGTAPEGTGDAAIKLIGEAMEKISQEFNVGLPSGADIKVLESTRSGQTSHEMFLRYMDEAITFAMLGDAPSVRGGGGQQASAAIVRNDVRLELTQADSDLLSGTLNRTLARWITEFNFPGAAPPKIWRDLTIPEDLKARSERDLNLYRLGYQLTREEAEKAYGCKLQPVAPAPANPPAAFAEPDGAFPGELETTDAIELGERDTARWLGVITNAVQAASDLADLRNRLLASFGALPDSDLARVMQAGFATAALRGLADAQR